MSDLNNLATQFVQYYYSVFQSDRNNLKPLYRDDSMLTFEGAPFKGVNDIIGKLTSLPFQQVAHRIATLDAQPSINNGIIVMVTGELLIDQETNATRFSQAFQLIPEGSTYWVLNDVFRLNYG
ncbi:nuclear transport factor 2 [Glomus cerebriforme]|uniref:Nuclear transport factor 2 n=1 Tax=Glomus cerebriforme TaxID=658196 RepID=A0A397T8D2_9GLOM|nr:nuclear transport factor 2 [Glomus cerebriforme]